MDFSHVKSSTRLEALSDAIFSIVATVMILPIAHTEFSEGEYIGTDFAEKILPPLGVYFVTFLIICNTWGHHVWLFMSINKVDDVTVLLNLALLLVTSFFPFTFTLLGLYLRQRLAILLFCSVVAVVGLIQFLFIFHAFRHPELLKEETRDNPKWRSHRNGMYASVLTPVIIAAIAAAFVPLQPEVSVAILVLLLFGNFLRRNGIRLYKKIVERYRRPELEFSIEEEEPMRRKLFTEEVNKERVECFSDGVYAIVATLIILDICETNIPSAEDIAEHNDSLAEALHVYMPVYLAYFATFVTVGLLSYVHHSLLHYIKEMNLLMVGFNNGSMLFIGAFPLAFKMATTYDNDNFFMLRNETLAIQINCVAIFMASAFLTALWVAALFKQEKFVLPEAHFGQPSHYYMCAKLSVLPCMAFLVYALSLGEDIDLQTSAFHGMEIVCLGLFILLHILFTCYKENRLNSRHMLTLSNGADEDTDNIVT